MCQRGDIEKHLTVKNCNSMFLTNILRFKNQTNDFKSTIFQCNYNVIIKLKTL